MSEQQIKWFQLGRMHLMQGHESEGAIFKEGIFKEGGFRVIMFTPTGTFRMGVEGVSRRTKKCTTLEKAKALLTKHINRGATRKTGD